MQLQLRLLGDFEARLASGAQIELANRKAEALLAYLAFFPGKRHSRERLADLLWSDGVDEHARNSLRQSLTALRKALAEVEPSPIVAERDMVSLDPKTVEVDAVRFEALVEKGSVKALEQACELYRGELLKQFASGDPVFESWLLEERRRLHDLMISALGQLLACKIESGQSSQAIVLAQRLLTLDPLQEAVHRTLMQLYAENGHREAALKQHQICHRLLEDELGVEPEAETENLLEAIREGRVDSHHTENSGEANLRVPGEASLPELAPPEAHTDSRRPAQRLWFRAALVAVLVFLLAGGLIFWLQFRGPRVEPALETNMAFPLPDKPSIAVLPFVNLSDDLQQGYFADGMTNDLITDLARINGFFVISQHPSFAYKDQPVQIKRVAEELGVRYVLEGSVRRTGEQMRINAQLVDALTGFHLWAGRFEGPLKDVFAFQDDILQQIATALSVNLSPEELSLSAKPETQNSEAYDAFLRGWQYARVTNASEHAKAIPHLRRAIELDPNYSRAYAALAHVYWFTFAAGWQKSLGLTQKELMDLTVHNLSYALKDPTPLAYTVALHVHFIRGEYEEGFAAAENAIASGVADPDSYDAMTKAYLYTGRPSEAFEILKEGAHLDPLNPKSYIWRRGQVLYHLVRYQDAAEQFRLALEIGDDFTDTHMYLAAVYGQLGKVAEAETELDQIKIKEKHEDWSYSVLSVDSWSFSNEKTRQQFREGLRKAGLEEIPWGYDLNSPNMIRGDDLSSLYFGQTIKGTDAQSGKERIISISEDGMATSRIGELVDTGVVDGWHDEKLCIRWEGEGRICVVTFRNPDGTPEQSNEYDFVYFGGVIPFSPID